ncbi:hypothetical protein [Microbacterium sp. A1-JK]|uniref:hypothetical protein n=1 Tax=Microbacterium sp. A1-JK TaxID=3177516 RepID=UPI003885E1B7
MTLSPDTMLDIRLSTICSKHRYDSDPRAAIDELLAAAGHRTEILAHVAGTWSGYHGEDDYTRVLAEALRGIPGAERWVSVGKYRRGIPNNGATPLPPTPRLD